MAFDFEGLCDDDQDSLTFAWNQHVLEQQSMIMILLAYTRYLLIYLSLPTTGLSFHFIFCLLELNLLRFLLGADSYSCMSSLVLCTKIFRRLRSCNVCPHKTNYHGVFISKRQKTAIFSSCNRYAKES